MKNMEKIYNNLENQLIKEFELYIRISDNYKFNEETRYTMSDLEICNKRCQWYCEQISIIRESIPKANLHVAAIWNEYKQKALSNLNKLMADRA